MGALHSGYPLYLELLIVGGGIAMILTIPRSRPQTTRVFSSSSASNARRIISSATEANRTAVAQRSSEGDVSSRGARKNAGQ